MVTAPPLITTGQVAVINRARRVLANIASNAHMAHDSQASGMIYARAETAREDLFALLNWFNSYADGGLTYAQLHNEMSVHPATARCSRWSKDDL